MDEREYPSYPISDLAFNYDMIHAANINLARMAPDLIDGLKPVQRRILYIMYTYPKKNESRKVMNICGEVLGKAHPHGDVAIKDALVGITQEWNNLIPFITGEGNFGSSSGDPPAAARYIKAKLSDFAWDCFFDEFKDSSVDMEPSYDEESGFKLPVYLPAKYPVVLLNGSKGIGKGASVDLPSFNFREILEATIQLMRDERSRVVLIPDVQTGADVVECDFGKLCDSGKGTFTERCKYEINDLDNEIIITSLPENISAMDVRLRISELIKNNTVPEIVDIMDLSKEKVRLVIKVRDDANPYKMIRKLIQSKLVAGLECNMNYKISITHNRRTIDYSISRLLLDWIRWRRDQVYVIFMKSHKRLLEEYRFNEVKLFIMHPDNLQNTIDLFRKGKDRKGIEQNLIEHYRDSSIRMDSFLAHSLSDLRLYELCEDSYLKCVETKERLTKELEYVESLLEGGSSSIDKVIIAQLREGIKKYGAPRRSNVVPKKISITNEVEGHCILQLSSTGSIIRKICTNAEMEPIPTDPDGFACLVDNDSSFILIDDTSHHSFIRAKDIPLDIEVPVMRYARYVLNGNIIAMLPIDLDSNKQCILISNHGSVKKVNIRDISPTKRPLMGLSDNDKLCRSIIINPKSSKDILIYTKNGMGQRLKNESIRLTLPSSKGVTGIKLDKDDEIIGCFAISPEKEYLLYVTANGKMRLNNNSYLPTRKSKDEMVQLIILGRDKLVAVRACNKNDWVRVFFDDATYEDIELRTMKESTMSSDPIKMTKKNAVTYNVTKVTIF